MQTVKVKEIILLSTLAIVCIFSLFIAAFGEFYGFSAETVKNFSGYLEQSLSAALIVGATSE
jgi:hypothetical protein